MPAAADPGRTSQLPQIAAAGIALLAVVTAAIGMAVTESPPGFFDAGYRILQLFVLDGAALDQLTVNPWLDAARFLAAIAVFLTVFVALRGLLGEEFRRWRVAARWNHAIVCGDGDAAAALARNLRESGRHVLLVGSESTETAGGKKIPAVSGDPRRPATLRAAGISRAQDLYACAPRSAANAAVALAAGRLRAASGSRLATYAQVRSDDLVEALRVRRLAAAQPDNVSMDFFALDDIAARLLVARHPPAPGTTPVLIGFGSLGQAVLRAIVRGPGSAPQARRVIVVTAASAEVVQAQAARFDAARRGWDVRPGDGDGDGDGDGQVYVCLADEDEAISTGLRLGRADDRDVVVCLQWESPFTEALDSAVRLKIFGVLDEACKQDAIAGDSIVSRTARAIHERYRSEAADRGESVSTNPSMKPWIELPVALQESNFAQAEHIGRKLEEIGASLTTRSTATPFAFSDREIEQLARLEHTRWMAERRARGYRHGPRREGVRHPDMQDWENLSELSQDKDRDAVRHLPDLLGAEGLYIRRGPAV